MNLNEIISGLLAEMRKISGSETVVGKPITVGEATIVPVCKIGIGFGTGAMDGKAGGSRAEGAFESGGAGGGIGVEPLAFLVVTKEGGAQLLSLKDAKTSALGRVIDLVPEVVDKIMGTEGPARLEAGLRHGETASPTQASKNRVPVPAKKK